MAKRFSATHSTPAAPGRRSSGTAGQTKQQQEDAVQVDRKELRAGTQMSGNATRRFLDTLRKKKSA